VRVQVGAFMIMGRSVLLLFLLLLLLVSSPPAGFTPAPAHRSYEDTSMWPLLERPPQGLSLDFVKAERSNFRCTCASRCSSRLGGRKDVDAWLGVTVAHHA
jgi:hypothetical protein